MFLVLERQNVARFRMFRETRTGKAGLIPGSLPPPQHPSSPSGLIAAHTAFVLRAKLGGGAYTWTLALTASTTFCQHGEHGYISWITSDSAQSYFASRQPDKTREGETSN